MNNLTKYRNYLKPVKIGIELAEKEKRVGDMDVIADYFHKPSAPDDWVHNLQLGRLVPYNVEYECMALVNNVRIGSQLCLSNATTFVRVSNRIDENIKTHPEIKYWSISQGDNDMWCECEQCRREKPFDTLIRFINLIAWSHPEKQFHTLLYYRTEQVGNTEPEPNVMVNLTTIQLSKGEPLRDSARADSVNWRNNLRKLLKLTTNVGIWDYYGNFKHLLAPNPTLYSLGENLKWYRSLGIQNYIIQTDAGIGHEFSELKSEIIKQMLSRRGVFRNQKSIILNWLRKEYGRAALDVRKYIDLLHENRGNLDYLNNWRELEAYRWTFLSEYLTDRYRVMIQDAYIKNKNLKTLNLELGLLYSNIELGRAERGEIRRFKVICNKLGNVTVNEQGKTWEEYLKEKGLM